MLNIAAGKCVVHLTAREFRKSVCSLNLDRCRSLPRGPVGVAKISDLACPDEVIQRSKCFFDRCETIVTMDDVEVDIVRSEPLQAGVTCSENVGSGESGLHHRLARSEADLCC